MSKRLARLLAWFIAVTIVIVGLGLAYYLVNLTAFQTLMEKNLAFPIRWETVKTWQLYTAWSLSAAYVLTGLAGLGYLHLALKQLGNGDTFSLSTSRWLRRFSVYLMIQAVFQPVYMALMSLLLSLRHPAGQKMLVISAGSNELKLLGLGVIFWIISDLLLKARLLEKENQQFI